jgi:hypothetical protein
MRISILRTPRNVASSIETRSAMRAFDKAQPIFGWHLPYEASGKLRDVSWNDDLARNRFGGHALP